MCPCLPRASACRKLSLSIIAKLLVKAFQQDDFMSHIIFWILGFGTFWAGLKLFDDEVILIVSVIVGSAFVLAGLVSSPLGLQIGMEITLIIVLFNVCMQCIKRGDRP